MNIKRKFEVCSAGCPACEETVALGNRIARPSFDVETVDMRDLSVAAKAKPYGVSQVSALVVKRVLAECCEGQEITGDALHSSGVGSGRR
jgi:glutaredoxin 3